MQSGEIVGLIGPNGAGKSTLLHAIMGLVPARQGEIRLSGTPLLGLSPERVARSGVALVPEGRRIFAGLTVEENLRLGLAARRSREGAEEDIEAVYELFPVVSEFRRRPAGVLSGGQQQQLAIGRALVARPDLLLLDEPSLGLAPKIVDIVFEALARDPPARVDRAARRATRAAHGRVRRSDVPDLERRAATLSDPGGRR